MKTLKSILIIALLLIAQLDTFAQCAMCRGTVESTVSNGRSIIASDLNFGILYLLVIPYIIVATIAFVWYRNSKKEYVRRLEVRSRVRRAMS
jgi:hypothetical protein